ncbi:MAG: Lrp/AsnC ligand binding domain-containing protein [Nitrososphaerales archaeon]
MRAYLEIDIESGRDVIASAEFIRQIEGVIEAHAVSDKCDVFAAVEAADFRSIYELVMRKIQVIKGVTDTRILPCVDMEEEHEAEVEAEVGNSATSTTDAI